MVSAIESGKRIIGYKDPFRAFAGRVASGAGNKRGNIERITARNDNVNRRKEKKC